MISAQQKLNKNITIMQGDAIYLHMKFKRKTSRVTEGRYWTGNPK